MLTSMLLKKQPNMQLLFSLRWANAGDTSRELFRERTVYVHYLIQFFRDVRLASLVAHHSEATFEARLRGYAHALHAFPCEYSAVADALTFCDMTTSPEGKHISFEERIAEILCRYKEQDIVSQSIRQATPTLSRDVERTKQMLHQHEINAFYTVGVI